MTVAYRYTVTPPTETDIFRAIQAAVDKLSLKTTRPEAGSVQLISLSLPLPPIDLLAALVELQTDGQDFYWESPHLSDGVAAGGCVMQWTGSGRDRFTQGQQVAERWFSQVHEIGMATEASVHILCRFTFEDEGRALPNYGQRLWPAAATLFIPRWQVTRRAGGHQFTATFRLTEVSQTSTLKAMCVTLWRRYTGLRQLAMLPEIAIPALRSTTRPLSIPLSRRRRQQFLQGVEALLQAIEQRRLTKAVLASTLDLNLRTPLPWVSALRLLRHRYSGCHSFMTRYGQHRFLGASPERLFCIRQQQLSTDAIAGSAPRGATPAADRRLGERLRHSEKELHEHRIVADFIVGRLRHLGLQPTWSPQPQLLRLANIQHLHTPIAAAVPRTIHPLQILANLHPTPAVAGLPQRAACDAIASYEAVERSLYAAPLGWINRQGESEFIVGIRSASVDETRIRLYAGAGIVQGSAPLQEWREINMKLRAIASVLSVNEASVAESPPSEESRTEW